MKAEMIAVGTELLLGQIVNTNAQYISRQLSALGIDVYFQVVVGDNFERIKQALSIAKERADLIIMSGGLGPTQDDLTKEALAAFTGRPLLYHQPSLDKITHFFQVRGIRMTDNNRKQAQILEGSTPLANEAGLAVGVALQHDGTAYVLLPGPPKELIPMFENEVKPWLLSLSGGPALYSKMLKFAGIGESLLEHALSDVISSQQDPTIAPYANEGEVTLRLSTKAKSREEASGKLRATEEIIKSRLGDYLYAEEDISLEEAVVALLKNKGLTLSTAESCSGGLLGRMITSVPGSSQVYPGGVICYSNATKHRFLQVPMELMEGPNAPGAISEEAAKFLAEQVRSVTGSDFSLAVTGVAGPSPAEGKPVGTVYIGMAQKNSETEVKKLQLTGTREIIQLRAAKSAVFMLWERLKNV